MTKELKREFRDALETARTTIRDLERSADNAGLEGGNGLSIPPTVFDGVTRKMTIARKEV